MRRDINIGLIISVILLLGALAALTTYFGYEFEKLHNNYQEELKRMSAIQRAWQNSQGELDRTSLKLERKLSSEKIIKGKYFELYDELNKLEHENKNLNLKIEKLKRGCVNNI